MNVLTLKIPEELDAALQAASRARGLSKSAVVREALEQSLGRQLDEAGTAERWVAHWRGRLASGARKGKSEPDERFAHLMAKHVR
jgi:predicted transcriptional regulator